LARRILFRHRRDRFPRRSEQFPAAHSKRGRQRAYPHCGLCHRHQTRKPVKWRGATYVREYQTERRSGAYSSCGTEGRI